MRALLAAIPAFVLLNIAGLGLLIPPVLLAQLTVEALAPAEDLAALAAIAVFIAVIACEWLAGAKVWRLMRTPAGR